MSPLRKFWTACKLVLMAIGLFCVLATVTPIVSWWARTLAGPWNDPPGEILIVPGAEILSSDGMIGEGSYWRSVYAVRVWREGGFQQLILAGGPPDVPIGEAMRKFVVCAGVPEAAAKAEVQSHSTRENALFTREMLGGQPGRKVLLTSDYHMFRAWRTFRKAGIAVDPRPIPDMLKRAGVWRNRPVLLMDLMIETGKIGYYWLRDWI